MPASSIVPASAASPPPAYPDPIHLPVSPHGDPHAVHLLAQAYGDLADRFDRTATQVSAISADLATRWHGHGSTALHTPIQTVEGNLRALANAYRQAADHLEEYATALHKAQHHHGWSLGKIIAVGAAVTVTSVAIVVTVGAAAPVGTLAAAEVGEAIVGAEAAAAGATAAESAATSGLALTAQSMSGLRTLTALALPHLTQGAVSAGIDTGLHLATGHRISGRELTESFLAGTLGSSTTAAARSALRSSEAYAGARTLTKAALDTTALSATLTADTALGQYANTGHLNPTALTEDALLTAMTGGAATLRHPLEGTVAIARPRPSGQSLRDLMENGFHPQIHEGPFPWGHAITRHVAQTRAQLEARLASDSGLRYASTFYDMAALTRAGNAALKENPGALAQVLSGSWESAPLTVRLAEPLGTVLSRAGAFRTSSVAKIIVVKVGDNVVIRTAFVM